ncbi:MAG: type II toxin-antitoxin system PemK/MazF family toxin [Bacteroidota bacterium]
MKCKQFEIWLADLNPRFGTETGKTRPVLIVQSDLLNTVHPSSIICPITTNVRKGVSILRVNVSVGEGGLKRDSSIMIDQVRAIDNKRLIKKLGILSDKLAAKVKENLQIVMDL